MWNVMWNVFVALFLVGLAASVIGYVIFVVINRLVGGKW